MTSLLSILAVLNAADTWTELSAACAEGGVRLEPRFAEGAPLGGLLTPGPFHDAMVVELRPDRPEDQSAIRAHLASGPACPVIVVGAGIDVQTVRELMRLGAVDVLPRPVGRADLRHAVAAARDRAKARPERNGTILSFLRSCGGAGSTTLAIQTAMELMGRDRRNPKRVCLIDFDLQFGNAGLSLDLAPGGGLMTVLSTPDRLDGEFLGAAMARHASGLDVLAAPSDIVPLDALSVELAERILALCAQRYDHVVVELPHAWTAWSAAAVAVSSLVALVLRPDVTSIERARRHLGLMQKEEMLGVPVLTIANQVETPWGWKGRLAEAEKALGRRIDAVVRADRKTADTARERGVPLREVAGGSVIEKDVRTVVDQALKTLKAEPAAAPAETARGALRPVPLLRAAP